MKYFILYESNDSFEGPYDTIEEAKKNAEVDNLEDEYNVYIVRVVAQGSTPTTIAWEDVK